MVFKECAWGSEIYSNQCEVTRKPQVNEDKISLGTMLNACLLTNEQLKKRSVQTCTPIIIYCSEDPVSILRPIEKKILAFH